MSDASERAFAHGELSGYSVLVVEDDDDGRDLLVELLTPLAIRVHPARDARVGIALFERERPDLIVSDLYMPGGHGFDLIDEVRRRPFEHGGLTPAIAITAGTDTETEALLRGFHCWFAKPLDVLKLLDAIRSFAAARIVADAASSARMTAAPRGPGVLLVSSVGHTRIADVRMTARAIRAHLERAPQRLVIDLRRNTGFDLAAPYLAQHELWSVRHAIESVLLVGGPLRSQLVARAACAILRVACTAASDLPPLPE